MFHIRNAVSKRSWRDDTALTARIDIDVLEDMHRRYHTAFQLDDEVLSSQSGCMHHRSQHPLPWGLCLAFCGIALWLVALLYATLIGGIYLG